MGWRVVSIENPAHLSLEQGSLVVKRDEIAKLPIEDIDVLVIDNYAVTMSANLLGELATNNVATVICDSHHTPCSITEPLSQHSRQAKVSQMQINMSQPLRKNLWQIIVKQKIINQAAVLSKFDYSETAGKLIKLATEVRSGDTTNRESIAASLYFAELFDDATRRRPTWYNSALNYTYAIMRSVVARSVAARGFVPSLGLFHHNELNSFNLTDDLIEPYRAFADDYVLSTIAVRHVGDTTDANLSKDDRHLAIDILNNYVIIKNKRFTVRDAIGITAESLVQAISENSPTKLELPRFK